VADTKVDIANLALSHLGEAKPVTDLDTPSTPNEIHLARFYPIAREICLKAHPWKFAVKKALLVIQDADDLDGPFIGEWGFAYITPSDLVRLLKVLPEGASKNEPSVDFDRYTWALDALTPSSTDLTGDTVTFTADHGLTTGMVVRVATTGFGLTAATDYYVNVVDNDTVSFHTTYAAAVAGTGKVNLTTPGVSATITPAIVELILTNSDSNVYADYIALVTDVTRYTEDFVLALSYKLASLVAPAIIKAKNGIALSQSAQAAYLAAIANAATASGRQGQNSDHYKDHKPTWVSNR
jgi:hypothetical protein